MWNPFFPDWRNANLERTEVDISFFFSLLFLLSSNEIARLVIISIFRHWRRLNEQEKFRRFRWLIVILLRRIFERKSEVRNKLAEESMIFNWHICLRWKEMKIWLKLFCDIGDNGKNNFIYFFLKICLKSILKIYLNKSVYFFFSIERSNNSK